MKRQQNVLVVASIIGAIVVGIGMFAGIGWMVFSSLKQPPEPSQEAALAKFMPKQPDATELITQGYDPKTRCFDKCGYLYRRYSYTDQATICKNLFAVFVAEGDQFTITSPSTTQPPSESWCEDTVRQSRAFRFEMEAPVMLKTGVRENSRTIASIVVNPQQKTIEYRVSESNEGITITR